MPINIPNNLPAAKILEKENIFVMKNARAKSQDVRPLRIAILNLMPDKITTETQLLRLLGNTPIQVEITLLHPESHTSKNTSANHLSTFYKYFCQIKRKKFDGLIITGAPVEHLEFEEVDYWEELKEIMDWSKRNVFSTLHICWGAQAGLYHHFGVRKYPTKNKIFGIFEHEVKQQHTPLLRGFDDRFFAPQSRHSEIRADDIKKINALELLAESKISGVHIIISKDNRQIFLTGHFEYNSDTLKIEYERDKSKGLDISLPKNYFPKNDSKNSPIVCWRAHANLLFSNWLNYYVYQETPFDLRKI